MCFYCKNKVGYYDVIDSPNNLKFCLLSLLRWFLFQQVKTCSKSTLKTLYQNVKSVQTLSPLNIS